MKRILFLFMLSPIIYLSSCSEEESTSLNDQSLEPDYSLKIDAYYKGNTYELKFKENDSGEIEPLSELPEALKELDEKTELATLIDGEKIYFFDNEQSKFEYYGIDYNTLLESRSDAKKSILRGNSDRSQSVINNFNSNVGAFEASNFRWRRLNIRTVSDFFNFRTSTGLNDKISSIFVSRNYTTPGGSINGIPITRRVIFYEAANFGGRSLEVNTSSYFRISPNFRYEIPNLASIRYGGFLGFFTRSYNDRFSSVDIILNGRSEVR